VNAVDRGSKARNNPPTENAPAEARAETNTRAFFKALETSTPDRPPERRPLPLDQKERACVTVDPGPVDRLRSMLRKMTLVSVIPSITGILYTYECANGRRHEIEGGDVTVEEKAPQRRVRSRIARPLPPGRELVPTFDDNLVRRLSPSRE
jgi:hypothetical protein